MVSTRQSSNAGSGETAETASRSGKHGCATFPSTISTRQTANIGACASGSEAISSVPDIGASKSGKQCSVVALPSQPPPPPIVTSDPPPPGRATNLLELPVELLIKIFENLTYRNIAQIRPVCHKIDSVCSTILNSTFQRLQNQMLVRFQNIKAKMPRRESARRNHPLACESDIIETLHMRLTLLQMSFGKHIERKHCCFFPGEILDEVHRILHYIKVTPKLGRPYKVTDELFDLSTMAMEYFKEKIEPTLPEITYFPTEFLDFGSFSGSSSGKSYLPLENRSPKSDLDSPVGSGAEDSRHSVPQSNMVLRKRISKIKQGMKRYNSQLSLMRRDLRNCKNKMLEQQKQILEYATRLDENDKKNEETSRKFSTLLQELNKCKTELQYWRSKSPANPAVCVGCGKVVPPLPTEDLQALANQGVVPEGLDLALANAGTEPLNFVPIASTSSEFSDYWESASISEDMDLSKKDAVTSTSVPEQGKEPMAVLAATPKSAVSHGKRKSTDCGVVHEPKKLRRMLKSRCKRGKI